MSAPQVHWVEWEVDEIDLCDYCRRPVAASEPRTVVGSALYHRAPDCYAKKLAAIRRR
jgi:hypothetical protein